MDLYYLALYFFVYGFLGWCAEVGFAAVKESRFVNRGFLNGPICPIYGVGVTIVVAFLTPIKSNLMLLYLTSVILVTVLEGLTGWAMYKIFHNKWWDYSSMPFNIGGYVCLPFSAVWGVACVAIMDVIHPVIHGVLTHLPHLLGVILITALGVTLFVDLYVTASAIFRFNRHMERMEKAAAELRELSDRLGEDIFERTMQAMERAEERAEDANLRERAEELRARHEKLRARYEELHARYEELRNRRHRVFERLVDAFPAMESHIHTEQLREFKKRIKERVR